LLERILRSPDSRLTLVEGPGSVKFHANRDILELAAGLAGRLRAQGAMPGTRVCIAAPTSIESVVAILAAWMNGAAVAVLPSELGSRYLSAEEFLSMLRYARPAALIASDAVCERLAGNRPECSVVPAREALQCRAPLDRVSWTPPRPDDPAILQFTSGSTGSPKAAVVTHAMLAHNYEAVRRRAEVDERDVVVSWLPLHHDMGMSVLAAAWWCGVRHLVLIPTAAFARRPLLWLETIARFRGSVSPAPMFAYVLIARTGRALADADLDLSSWRYAWVGAEPVFERHLSAFRETVRALGMPETALQPAYGMAESVVAVSMGQAGRRYRLLHVDRESLFVHNRARPVAPDSPTAVAYVSNGAPVDGMQTCVLSEKGERLEELRVGRICVRGPSVMRAYFGHAQTRDPADWFDTGDLGFLFCGEIFVTGRRKDLIIRAGVNINPHLIEWAAESHLGLRSGRSVAFSHLDAAAGREEIVVVVGMQPRAPQAEHIRADLARELAHRVGVQIDRVVFVRGSSIAQTTSGKVRRAQMKADYARGALQA
jgi:acyl-CoA synthetase (AMP-forming)/AMP-acid ligase II